MAYRVWCGRCLDADLPTINQNGTIIHSCGIAGVGIIKNGPGTPAPFLAASPLPLFNQGSTIAGSRCRPVLDAGLGTLQYNGTKIQLWECTGNYNQYFWNPLP